GANRTPPKAVGPGSGRPRFRMRTDVRGGDQNRSLEWGRGNDFDPWTPSEGAESFPRRSIRERFGPAMRHIRRGAGPRAGFLTANTSEDNTPVFSSLREFEGLEAGRFVEI